MPELPEVETIACGIAKAVKNCRITDVRVFENRLREPIPADFVQKICGAKIQNIKRIAKYITLELDNGLSLIWHMGMSGKVKIFEKAPSVFEKHDHVLLQTDKSCLIYNDARRFGILTYEKTSNLPKCRFFAKLGKEPFEQSFDATYLLAKFKNKKTPVKNALLDQEIVVGIGNIYASEILFLSQISPLREAGKISLEEAQCLVKNTRFVLEEAIKAGGSSIHDYKKTDGSLGYFQNKHCVYNKKGQKCPGCSCNIQKTGGIQKIIQAGRSSYYCATKQK